MTTLANAIDDQSLGTTSLQDAIDEIESGAGLSTSGQYVVSSSATYINSATSIHNATQILDYHLNQQATLRANEMATHEAEMASTGSGSGSALVGYDGHAGANSDFSIAAKRLDLAIDDIVDAIDADREEFDVYEADILSQVATKGAAKVGYDGQAGANSLFSLAASQVDAALDSLAIGLDAEKKDVDDYIADVLSQTSAKGAAKVGYDGQAGANSLFTLAASQVDAALDSIVTRVDAEMKVMDDYQAELLSQTATEGAAKIGYDGQAGANSLFSLAASKVDAALDSVALKIDAEMKVLDDYQAELLSQASTEGAAKIGYDGKAGSNGDFTLAASQVDAALDSIVDAIDADRQEFDVFEAALLANATGAAKVGYDGQAGANSLFSLSTGS